MNYQDIHVYDIAKVIDVGDTNPTYKYRVEYITQSTIPWSANENINNNFIPLNPAASDLIRQLMNSGKEVYITRDWNQLSNEVLIVHIASNPVSDLFAYKRRASSFIKSFINPMMASAHASIVYGFTTLNNKFIEHGLVFSEKTRSLKIIKVMDISEELEETNPELSKELMDDLEQYIEYKDILARTNFIWNESEKYIKKIDTIIVSNQEDQTDDSLLQKAKEQIDDIVSEFQNKIRTLNNLK